MNTKLNIIVILCDDMGYSDIGCYGGEVLTPNIDRLAENGIRFVRFYNTPRCSPSRASLLTGLHPHQTGMGHLALNFSENGYPSQLNHRCVTIAEVLKDAGYMTYMSGKWHLDKEKFKVSDSWPKQRGFDEYYGIIAGAANYFKPLTLTRGNENIRHEIEEGYYLTDAIADNACEFIREHIDSHSNSPFFEYVAFTAPHWPLQAFEDDIAKYKGRFDKGWDILRQERYDRMVQMGLVKPNWEMTPRDSKVPPWTETVEKEWETRRMEVYAAQIDRMDQGIGRIIQTLEKTNQLENTVIMFLSDNGGCAEEINRNAPYTMPGSEDTFMSYGRPWANLSNTPYRLYKHYTHEGGIATPLIIHWPEKIRGKNQIRYSPAQLIDIMPTIIEITGARYPKVYKGREILPMEGVSLIPIIENDIFSQRYLFWEHEGNLAVEDDKWKLVKLYEQEWELYDMENDRTEMNDLAGQYPELVRTMNNAYQEWSERVGVIPWGTFYILKEQEEGF